MSTMQAEARRAPTAAARPSARWGLLSALALTALAPCAQAQVHVWQRWQADLPSAKPATFYVNAYRDVVITATYRLSGSSLVYTSYGFWDGGTTFRLRFAFPYAGTWTWTTTCAGAGCNTDTGLVVTTPRTVTVSTYTPPLPPTPANPIFRDGFLTSKTECVSVPTFQCPLSYLTHWTTQKPFFWLGDTAWAAPVRANLADWSAYVDGRQQQGFTVIQMALATEWAEPNAATLAFEQISPALDPTCASFCSSFCNNATCSAAAGCKTGMPDPCSRWLPTYWQNLDAMVDYANSKGLFVALVGVMDPLDRDKYAQATSSKAVFARNLVARLRGSAVVFAPGFDDKRSNASALALMQIVGTEIRNGTSQWVRVTNHQAAEPLTWPPMNSHAETWNTVDMVQSGQAQQDPSGPETALQLGLRRAIEVPQYVRALADPKALVNGEAIYDENLGANQTHSPYHARQAGYYSALSGAGGFTFGALGLWDWGSLSTGGPLARLSWPSAGHMQQYSLLFKNIAWQRLVGTATEHARIKNPGANGELRLVLARDASNLLVAYLPREATEIRIDFTDVTGFPGSWASNWVNPRNGAMQAATPMQVTSTPPVYKFVKPTCGSCDAADWVLKLTRSTALAPVTGARVETFAAHDPASDRLRVFVRQRTRAGVEGTRLAVSDAPAGHETAPQMALDAQGHFTVVWRSEGPDGEPARIWARRFDAAMRARAAAVLVDEASEGQDVEQPAVTLDGPDGFAVVWTRRSAKGLRLFGQRFGRDDVASAAPFALGTGAAGDEEFAQVLARADGQLVVAWERALRGGLGRDVVVRVFDALNRPVTPEARAHAETGARHLLAALEPRADGDFRVVFERAESPARPGAAFVRSFDAAGAPRGAEVALTARQE